MGFLDKAKKAIQQVQGAITNNSQVESVNVVFGENYISQCRAILNAVQAGNWKGGTNISVSFDIGLIAEIDDCIRNHHGSNRVLYSDDSQFLDVVGESFYQDELKRLQSVHQQEWLSGFLMPQPLNPHDPNAIAVVVIAEKRDKTVEGEDYEITVAGFLAKEQAKKISKKVVNYCEQDAYIPIIGKFAGGTPDKPSIGLIARAKTNKVKP